MYTSALKQGCRMNCFPMNRKVKVSLFFKYFHVLLFEALKSDFLTLVITHA